MAKNPKDTIEFLLGEIVANTSDCAKDIVTIKKNQATIMNKINHLEQRNAWLNGIIFAVGALGGVIGGFIKGLFTAT